MAEVTLEMFRAKLPDSDRVLRLPPARLLSNLHLAIRQVEQPPLLLPDYVPHYCRSHKRRLVDSCGHERCYSCIGNNKKCILCKEMGESRSDSKLAAAHCPPHCAGLDPGEDRTSSLADHKRSRLESLVSLSPPSHSSSPANTLPRRRKVTRRSSDAARTSPRLCSGQSAGSPGKP